MGLGIIHALAKLNRGSFDYNKCSDNIYEKDRYIHKKPLLTK